MSDENIKMIPVITYSRVVGYFSPVSEWNKGKKEEFKNRKLLKLPEIVNQMNSIK